MRRFLILSGLAVAGCASNASPTGPEFRSGVKGVEIAAASRLPVHPGKRDASEDCGFIAAPKTPGGKAVQARGWVVTGEVAAHGYTAVSFVGSTEQGTSGSCFLQDGHIGLFRGGDLKALVWLAAGGQRAIGQVVPLEPEDIRIFDGDYPGQPLADLHFTTAGAAEVRQVAASETLCHGKAMVPNIYGMPITHARALLRKADWLPDPLTSPEERKERDADSRAAGYAAQGLPETGGCSGTGYGFCNFRYKGKAGILSVTTAGDEGVPSVVGYGMECR